MSSRLHPIERSIISVLAPKRRADFDTLVAESGLNPDKVRRGLQWLSSKGFVEVTETTDTQLESVRDPPELILIDLISKNPQQPVTIPSLRASFKSPQEFSAGFGRAKGAGWVKVDRDGRVELANQNGAAPLRELLRSISDGSGARDFTNETAEILSDLLKRGIVRRVEKRIVSVSLTKKGAEASPDTLGADIIDRLTPEILASGGWRGKKLRPIDVEARPPIFFPGRRHPVRDFIQEVRETYISMGFTELEGSSVHPAFWNFDALFIPQDHPGREMQDTFYLEGLSDSHLKRNGLVANVAATHEKGWKTGSKGWGYKWRIEEARRLVLRTHNTVLTVKALSASKEKATRVFAVSKVYRNENLDYKHLAEFYQMDGIIVGKGLNLRHLMGFLREFYKKLGMANVKLWPTFFPYTEPSLEVVGYSSVAKAWIELSGSGIFRPEVTLPLGVNVPVLAWGPGIERLMLMRFGLDDMRALYGVDLSWLRNRVELVGPRRGV